jgi:LPS-assembly protein
MVLRLTCLASAMAVLSASVTAAAQTPPPAPAPSTASNNDQEVLLQAKTIIEDTKNSVVTAEGDVEVRVGERTLRADRLVYDQGKQTMRASGHVQITDEKGQVQFSDEIEADEDFRNGFATRFSARLGGNAVATASSAIRTDGTRNALEQIVYTGCPICEEKGEAPTWSIRARRAVQNTETQMITYQDAVFEIKGVPVLYLPWFAHPDPTSKRRSGFITAEKPIGVSSKLGVFVEQPYYWAISPSQDLTTSLLLTTAVNPLVKVDYRQRFFSGFVDLKSSFTYEQEFNSDGDKFGDDTWRSHIYGRGLFAINQDWKWGFGIEHQSDDLYDKRYGIDGEDNLRGLVASQPRQLLTQLFTTGQQPDFYFEAASFIFQGLRAGDDDAKFPKVAPTIFTEKDFDLGNLGRIATGFSAVGLFRDSPETLRNGDIVLDTARATATADWNAQYIVGPGLVVQPFALGRGDAYRIDDGSAAGARDVTRVLGVAGTQVSYPFIRRGENVDVIVEPIVMLGYGTPNANNGGIPNEDSQVFEADDSNLFKPNAVSNYDLWEGGARASVGMSATAKIGKTMELSTTFGRRWRQDADPAFNALSNLSGKKSDYVASVRADLGAIFAAGARMRLDDNLAVNRIDVDATANFWRISGAARYFEVAENAQGVKDEGIVWNGAVKVSDHWSAIIEQARNIAQQQDIRLAIGVAYQDDCSYFALTYERQGGRDRTLGPSESIQFRFALTGLGAPVGAHTN